MNDAPVVELADTVASKATAERHEGSSPSRGTTLSYDVLDELDFDAVVPCEVTQGPNRTPCGNPADIAVQGECPACHVRKPVRNVICWQPHWIFLRDFQTTCAGCGHTGVWHEFHTIVEWIRHN